LSISYKSLVKNSIFYKVPFSKQNFLSVSFQETFTPFIHAFFCFFYFSPQIHPFCDFNYYFLPIEFIIDFYYNYLYTLINQHVNFVTSEEV